MQNISESLRRQRDQIVSDSSEDSLSRHTSLLEIAVITLYNRLANRLDLDSEQFRAGAAVLAMGSLGRGLIGPNQPIPILFLNSEALRSDGGRLDEIVAPLVEAGWTVDALQGTVDELMERAREDFDFFLRLLEIRYISGSRTLMEGLDNALDSFIEDRRDELLDLLYKSVRNRKSKLNDPQTWQEPDLHLSPGGHDDITAIRAACRIAGNIANLEDAIFSGYLIRQEVDLLSQAEKTYARLLSLLQSLSADADGVLHFDDQELLAKKLGYPERAGYLPVETFMQQLYQTFHSIACISAEFWERLRQSRAEDAGEDAGPVKTLERGVLVRSGKIYLQTDRYPATAGDIIRLFRLSAANNLGFANVTRQWIRHHRNALDTASGDASVKEELLELIRVDSPDLRALRAFYNQGLLTSLIPELAAVHGLVQHDNFHLYPVQEHHLRTLEELKRLFAGEYTEQEPELTQITRGVGDPVWLFLAGLLHDIGKSSGRGHALHGGEMIPAIARRLGLSPEEADTVQFLVAEHLVLMDNASLRDLGDREMLSQCAMAVRTPMQLDLLILLSFADMAATGPKAAQKWKDTPAVCLYEKVHHLLEKGEPTSQAISERIDHVRAQVGRELADLMGADELETYFEQLAPRYLLSMSPAAVARHLRLGRQLRTSSQDFVWEVNVRDEIVESTLMSYEIPGILSKAAGILTLHDMNIHGAQIFTMNDDMLLLIFQSRRPEGAGTEPDWDSVRADMRRLLEGKIALDYRISAHAASSGPPQQSLRPSPSRILIDNNSSAMYTILEVYSLDRVGLLYTISRTLFELQIRIYVAKITTKVDQVADVFYVKTSKGEKVSDPEQIEEIRNALLYWLDRPGGEA